MNVGQISPAFAAAFVAAQGAIEGAVKGSNNPAFRSKYADLGACWEACRDALQANGIGVLQFPTSAPTGYIGLTGTLVYGPTGETVSETFHLPVKDATSAQAAGSAFTYARRYQLCAMIGICPVDDDGNAATKASRQEQPPGAAMTQVPGGWVTAFAACKTKDDMKEQYTMLRNSQVAEPAKTEVLTVWAKRIKETK